MKSPREMISAKFERSAFVLTFETDEIIGYRAVSKAGLIRALYINLERRTVEYELSEGGLGVKRRTEFSPTVEGLIEGLPVTFDSFDQKLHGGLKLAEEEGVARYAGKRAPLARAEDPWDLTNYYDMSGKPRKLRLKPED